MRRLEKPAAVAAMMLLIIALLITSFQLAVYGDSEYKFYEREYEKYQVTEALNMEMEDVMDVTEKMMAYLIGGREELSVITWVDGKEQDFFNEQDRLHMADVKELFLGGLALRRVSLIFCIALIALLFFMKADLKRLLPRAYLFALSICGVLTAALGVLFSMDFTKYFVIFHEIFFTNDLWLFDAETDYMIRMLPEGFFYDMTVRIGMCFAAGLLVFLAVSLFALKWATPRGKRA